jgi:hypothetical protein
VGEENTFAVSEEGEEEQRDRQLDRQETYHLSKELLSNVLTQPKKALKMFVGLECQSSLLVW